MKLKFQQGHSNRLVIDFEAKTFNDDYYLIGCWDHCLELNRRDFKELKEEVVHNSFNRDPQLH